MAATDPAGKKGGGGRHPEPFRRPRTHPRPAPETQPGGFAVDAERVASLLDGRVRGAERDELLEQLVASDDDFHAFADIAAVLREVESEEPPPRIAAASTMTPDDVPRLRDELERVACELARLLREPECDEEGLWRLDARARELGQRLRSAVLPRKQAVVTRASARLFCGS